MLTPTERDYAPDYALIPPHGRWQHFDVGGRPRIDQLMASWPMTVDNQERTRRLMDLFLVSVLLDAGAGTKWQYRSKESGRFYRRSEGLAVASLEMFKAGLFSSDPNEPCQVDSGGLKKLDIQTLARGLQVTDSNPLDGLQGRAGLLMKLGDALQNQEVFGLEQRPGNMLGMYGACIDISWANHLQITFFHTLLRKHRRSQLSPFRRCGTLSWTAWPRSGHRRAHKSTASPLATRGHVK
jgi:hypothetical protein